MRPDRYMCLAALSTIKTIIKQRSAKHDDFATAHSHIMAPVAPFDRVHLSFN